LISGSSAFAEATNASPEEIDWFVGKWKVGPADVPAEFEFEVKKFGENYPWWPSDGPGPVARITGDDVFILASTTKGMADWDRGLQHTRCPE